MRNGSRPEAVPCARAQPREDALVELQPGRLEARSGESDGKTLEHYEHGLTMHIFAVSAAMLGVCLTAIDIAYAIV